MAISVAILKHTCMLWRQFENTGAGGTFLHIFELEYEESNNIASGNRRGPELAAPESNPFDLFEEWVAGGEGGTEGYRRSLVEDLQS